MKGDMWLYSMLVLIYRCIVIMMAGKATTCWLFYYICPAIFSQQSIKAIIWHTMLS